jgi:hypothetical protein
MPKRNDAFYGQDPGQALSEQARDEIEHEDKGAGHKGNNVDISQRYAQSEADEYTEQAERMTRDMERYGKSHIGLGFLSDPDKRAQFVESLAERLRGKPAMPGQPQEEKEEPFLSRAADDKFWGDKDELQRVGKLVRPKL